MSIQMKSIPFDAQEIIDTETGGTTYDRLYDSKDIADWLKTFFSNGVMVPGGAQISTELQVVKSTANSVNIEKGNVVINGRAGFLESAKSLDGFVNTAANSRIDRVVVEMNIDEEVRAVRIIRLPGTQAASPIAPVLTRDEINAKTWQLSLAKVVVGTAGITSVIDERSEDEVCGIAQVLIGVRKPKPVTGNSASNISFDDTDASLGAATVQEALDNLKVITDNKGNVKAVEVKNLQIALADWVPVTGYTKAKFKAVKTGLIGVDSNMNADVYFSPNDADSGMFSGGGEVGIQSLTILAKIKPTAVVTIPLVKFEKVVI